jgi:zinc transport system substrate-binding protein
MLFLKRILMAVVLCWIPFAEGSDKASSKALRVLTTVFPVDLVTREVVKGAQGVEVTRLLSSSAGCAHDYVITPRDRQKLEDADVIIANGLGLESFLEAWLHKSSSKSRVIALGESLSHLIEEKTPHLSHKHKHGHSAKKRHGSEHAEPHNPHVFASPKLMAQMARYLATELGKLSPSHRDLFQKNADAYALRLNDIHSKLVEAVKFAPQKRIVTHHGVFSYLARDIGIEVIGVIQEHEGQEPSTAALIKLRKLIKEKKVSAVFTEPQYPSRYGEMLAKEVGIPIAVLDPVASGPESAPSDYYELVMNANVETLRKILVGRGL